VIIDDIDRLTGEEVTSKEPSDSQIKVNNMEKACYNRRQRRSVFEHAQTN